MNSRILVFSMALLALATAGCIEFRQPKEFKNRKMKEDPPLLNQLPWHDKVLASKLAPATRPGV